MKVGSGALPCEPPTRVWGGPGTGTPCALCDEPVPKTEVEYELQFPTDEPGVPKPPRCFHFHCHAAWSKVCLEHMSK